MPYVEIYRSGKLLRRQEVTAETALRGIRVRLGKDLHVLRLSVPVKIDGWEAKILDGSSALNSRTGAPAGQSESARDAAPHLEGYVLQGQLGEGGMGVVWKGIQLSTKRPAAIKFLGKRSFASERSQRRFEREVELSAKLEHPNIARIYDSGIQHGVHYYAMQLIEGVALDQFVRDQKLSRRLILELMKTVCLAVQHAHLRGVIHRDLKPGNIMVSADGQPHVLDFGLAKTLLADDSATGLELSIEGEAAGTPAYMSPEQAAGHHSKLDTRTDVYSLGVILFRLLTGQSPHDLSGTRYEVIRRIVDQEAKPARQADPSIDRELEALLLKALEHSAENRYAGAGELAADINNYLTGEPLIARPATTTYFLVKRIRKHRVPVAAAATMVLVLVSITLFAYIRVVKERANAVAARNDALVAKDDAEAQRQRAVDAAATAVKEQANAVAARNDALLAKNDVEAQRQRAVDAAATAVKEQANAVAARNDALLAKNDAEAERQRAVDAAATAVTERANAVAASNDAEAQRQRAVDAAARAVNQEKIVAATNKFLNDMLSAADPRQSGKDVTVVQTLDAAVQKLNGGSLHDQPLVEAAVRRTIGKTFDWLNSGKKAAIELGKSLQLEKQYLPPDDPEIVKTEHALAHVQLHEGNNAAAATLERQNLATDDNDLSRAAHLNRLATALMRSQDLDGAANAAAEALAIRQKLLSADDAAIGTSLFKLAFIRKIQRRLSEAVDLFEKSLANRRKSISPSDPHFEWTITNLASTLEADGNPTEAEPLRREAVALCRKFGDKTLQGYLPHDLESLAQNLSKQGKKAEADKVQSELSTLRQASPKSPASQPISDPDGS